MVKSLLLLLLVFFINNDLTSQYAWELQSIQTPPRYIHITENGKVNYFSEYIMYYSNNMGLNWSKPRRYHNYTATAFFFSDSLNGLFQDAYNYIYKTVNGGLSWMTKCSVPYSGSCIHFLNQNTGWVSGDKILMTTNGGTSWTVQYNTTGYYYKVESIYMLNQYKGFATNELPDTLLVTTNGGYNWIKKPVGTGHYLRKVSFVNNNVGYILSDPGAFLKTTNGGDDWQIKPFTSSYNSLAFDFANENTGWLGNAKGIIYKTTNGGINWIQKRALSGGEPYDIINIKCSGSDVCFAAQRNGELIKTTNGGETWSYEMPRINGNLLAIAFINSQTGFVCAEGGKIWKTEDKGKNWIEHMTITFSPISMYADSINGCFISGSDGNLLHTTNFGNNWNLITFESNLNYISFIDQNTGWISGNSGKIYKTTNGGINWILLQTNISSNLNSHYFLNSITGWFAGRNNVLFKTTNAGLSFDSTGIYGNVQEVYFQDEQIGTITRNYSLFYPPGPCMVHRIISKTTNGGLNWVDVVHELDNCHGWDYKYYSLKFINYNYGFVSSSSGDFFRTTDAGSTWSVMSNIAGVPLNHIYLRNGNSGWAVGKYGLVMTMGDAIIGINNLSEITPEMFEISQNYPNPFNSSTNIKFRINKPEHLKLSVFDITGKEISVLMNSFMNPGNYDINFDGTGLASGIYFYSLSTGNKTITRRMALIK